MISVRGVTKRYGSARGGDVRPALDDVSFEVERGEIVGLLGPNGAGKTTLMRILSCFLAPTRGTAVLAGCSIADDTRAVRRALGYLPEAVPLPPEMRVTEYLGFRAALKGIARAKRRAAVDDAITIAGLADRRAQIIGTLSRGYRQRVGLADALLARPPILILDEPTIGLDPEGMQWLRETLRRLAAEGRTVFVSSHQMGELEDTADHLIVIGRGRLLADVSVSELIASVSGERVEIRTPEAHAAMRLLAGVGATPVSSGRDRVAVEGLPAHRVAELLASRQIRLDELRTSQATLEEAYFRLTRDAATHSAGPVAAERSLA